MTIGYIILMVILGLVLGKAVHLIDESNEEVSLMVINGAKNWDDFKYKNQT